MNEIILYDKPSLPEEWNYDESVSKVEPLVYKWKYLSLEMMTELWVAREMLSVPPQEAAIKHGTNVPRYTWAQYCRDIKLEKRTAKMLGVSHTTIQDDLRGGKKLPKEEEKSLKINNETTENGNKLPEPETTPLTGEQAVKSVLTASQAC
jgi:hypothetical protein